MPRLLHSHCFLNKACSLNTCMVPFSSEIKSFFPHYVTLKKKKLNELAAQELNVIGIRNTLNFSEH